MESRASTTAVIAALMRAAHLTLDGDPKIFADPLAGPLCGAESEAALATKVHALGKRIAADIGEGRAERVFRAMRATMVTRSRYAEDQLMHAVKRGVRQYVILGAGLDSFAYRSTHPDVRIFEVDLEASQTFKRTRLRELDVQQPSCLAFVPLDLEHRSLGDSLCAHGFEPRAPAFFSWLGTTQYLTEDATMTTLRQLASLGPGTEVVLQYQLARHLLDDADGELADIISERARQANEPWLSRYEPAALSERVREAGFEEVTDFTVQHARERYFGDRQDDLILPGMSHLMTARV